MTDVQPKTRQELYDRIREVGKDRYILDEMIRYGFWPAQGEIPNDPADEVRRRNELQQELAKLRQESRILHDEKALRQRLMQERLAESRRKRQETKERRERERQERAQQWQQRREREIVYLGEGVSGGLQQTEGNEERLRGNNLPIVQTAEEIAAAMEISVGELRFLAFHRATATLSHYIRFNIPKKTGGDRLISAPMPRLKRSQYWVLHHILEKIEVHDAVHGFRRERSILTNAQPHVGADVVINRDLQDFFPTISYKRVKGLFRALGYGEAAATIFALICTAADTEMISLDGTIYHVALTDRHLPQGSPASPAIANLICRRLDRRLSAMSSEVGFTYTRYADDLTFSASGESLRHICNVLRRSESIVTHEGFAIRDDKTRIMRRKSAQMEVTGIVVNAFPNLDRRTLKRFRATLYQMEKDGIAGKTWGNAPDAIAAIQGFANYVAMVNPEKGRTLQAQVKRIIVAHKP
jgi:RNA-directed DNA polymerase